MTKKRKYLILVILLVIVILSFVSSQPLLSFKQGNSIELIQGCDESTYSNITKIIYLKNSTILINSETSMTESVDDNYFYELNNTTYLGDYRVYGHCDEDGSDVGWTYPFQITSKEFDATISESIIYVVLFLGSFGIFLIVLWGSIIIPLNNPRNNSGRIVAIDKLKYFKIGLMFLSYVLIIWLVNLMISASNNLVTLSQFNGFFTMVFQILLAMAWPLMVIMILWIVYLAFKDWNLKSYIERGIFPRG